VNTKLEPEERFWCVIAHLSTLAMGMGLFLPVFGWAVNRRKSNYISFQCLQALGYQTLGYTIWILATLVFFVASLVGLAFGFQSVESLQENLSAWAAGHTLLSFGLIGLYFAFPIAATIACAMGYEFRYPFMGKRLAQYLNYARISPDEDEQWMIEEHEDRWVSSMGHFAIIVVFWGLAVPIAAWAMQGKRSIFLKFQSAQTVLFQTLSLLLFFGAGFFYVFGIVVFFLTVGFEGEVMFDSASVMIGGVTFLFSLLIALFILMVIPCMHILGQWAGYRVLKGDNYHYPIVGKMVLERFSKTTPPQITA
jgi:uncharacterized Tic20 family protein